MLCDAGGVSREDRKLGDVKRLSEHSNVAADEPPRHRAEVMRDGWLWQ
jgi:hypothetical protein